MLAQISSPLGMPTPCGSTSPTGAKEVDGFSTQEAGRAARAAPVKISVLATGIRIHELHVESGDVAKYLDALPDDHREQAIVDAVKLGVFCLERARAGQDLDFVRREIESLLSRVNEALHSLPDETRDRVTAKIGTGDGQVLAPLQKLVDDVSKAASEKVDDIRKLLQQEVDPTKETSSLGKALKALRNLLDPKRTDSVQGSLNEAVGQVTGESGRLAKAVRDVVSAALQPLEDKVTDLAKEVRGREAVEAALDQTTQKGASYEEEVVRVLQGWAQWHGAETHHLGVDNQSGDVLLVLPDSDGSDLRVIAEAKDHQSPAGRKVISDCLNEAMAKRGANAAIYVSKTRAGLAKEIGEWAEGTSSAGRWIACTHEHLATAVRFLAVQERLQRLRGAAPAVDAALIESQIQRIRTSLGKIKNIKTKATNIRDAASDIEGQADALRTDINGALSEMEDALKAAGRSAEPSGDDRSY